MVKSECRWIVTAVLIAGVSWTEAAERVKANNTDNLNLGTSWVGSAVPGIYDSAKWDITVTAPNSTVLGSNRSLLGVTLANPGGTVTIGGSHELTTSFLGFNLSAATVDLVLNMQTLRLVEYAGQIWNVGSGRVLSVNPAAVMRGYGASVSFQGAGTVNSSALANDATGIIGPWARIGSATSTRYASMSGSGVGSYLGGTAAATAADVTDLTGSVNYDVVAGGTMGGGASFNTLRYTGGGATFSGGYTANGMLNSGSGNLEFSGPGTIGADKELVLISPDSTRRITLSGIISDNPGGVSGVTVTGGGRVDLSGANTYSGKTVLSSGQLYVNHDEGLGSAEGETVVYVNGSSVTGGQLVLNNSVTILEPISFVGVGDGNPWNQALRVNGGGGTCALAGPVTISGESVRLTAGGAGTTLNIDAPVTRTSSGKTLLLCGNNGGSVNVNAPISNNGGSIATHSGPGVVRFNATGISAGTLSVQTDHVVELGVSDAFVRTCSLAIGGGATTGGNQARGLFDMAGYDQTFNSFTGDGVVTEIPTTRVVTNTSASLSRLTSGSNNGGGSYNGVFSGNIAYIKNGTGTQILRGPNSYTGGTTVNDGTLVLSNAVNHGALAVNGGTFRFSPSLTVNGNLSGTGGTIDTGLAGSVLTVEQAGYSSFAGVLNNAGALVKNGAGALVISGANTYSGGTTVNEGMLVFGKPVSIPGIGTLVMAPGVLLGIGVGAAGSFDSADVDSFWAGTYAGLPVASGAPIGIDTSGGDFTYATSQSVAHGLIKTGGNTLKLAGVNTYSGGSCIQGGVLSIAATTALPGWDTDGAYEVWPDAALAVGNAISDSEVDSILGTTNFNDGACIGFDTEAGDRIYAESIDNTAQGVLGVYKVGDNTLYLNGVNNYDGNTYLAGGRLSINSSSSLGSTNGYTQVIRAGGTGNLTDATGQLQIAGGSGEIELDENLYIQGSEQYGYGGAIRNMSGNNCLNGWIRIVDSGRITCASGNLVLNGVVLRDNLTAAPMLVLNPSSGTITVSNRVEIGAGLFNCHSGGKVVLASTNNVFGNVQIQYGCTVQLAVSEPVPAASKLLLGNTQGQTGQLDLNGFDQSVGGLSNDGTVASLPNNIIQNSSPVSASTFTVRQAAGLNETFSGRIEDAVNLVVDGSASSSLTLRGANSFSGSTVVRGGSLVLDATGTLGLNCTNVVVEAGTLALANSAAIADTATLSLAGEGGGTVDMDAGVNESVGYLFLNGEMQRAGTYGSSSSAAMYKNDQYFSGDGILTVRLDNSGTLVILR